MRRLWPLGMVLLGGCASPPVEGALLALVDFGADTTCQCVQVVVRTPDGTEVRSGPVATDRKRPVKVGIAKAGLPTEVTVYAVGFADKKCLTPGNPPERSEDGTGTFKASRTSTVALTVIRRPNQKDDDGDGYASTVSGGDDCDDTDASVHPGAVEACGDGADNDCDKATDCEEAGCADKACGTGMGALCRPPKCTELLCSDDTDNDGDGLRDCADSDCAGLACRNGGKCMGGSCQGASTEKDLCFDGADNDGDGKVDCDDDQCVGGLCNAGSACVSGARCDAAGACTGGTPVTCLSPASACQQATGTCNPADGGCVYAADPGKPCNDSNGCTGPDLCSDAGTCVGAPTICLTTMPCARAAGCAADAGCLFVPAVGDLCDDGNRCTGGESCQADAGCAGGTAAQACVPNACQIFANVCTGDGGCAFDVRDAGSACDGGVCNAGGTCIGTFPYPPSNFTESALPTPGGPTNLGCAVTLDSHLGDGGVGFGGWCGNADPPFRLLPRGAGLADAVLIAFSELDIGVDASVRTQGDRPVIFAATGSIRVLGEVVAQAGPAACVDGGAGGPVVNDNGGGGGGFGSPGAAGGKAGGGAGGAVNGEPLLIPLRGGCPGGTNTRGGGAIQLSAAGPLNITGTIAAPGRGGSAGQAASKGGNGAGSGGGILLEGLTVLVGPAAAVTANGGSGGEGGGLIFDGENGNDGAKRTEDPAAGASGPNGGGAGGNGAAGTTGATGGSGSVFGAGGGGAGVGRVRINAPTGCSLSGNAKLSPRPTSGQQDAGCI